MVNFNFSYAPGTSLQQMVGFETAGRVWSSLLSDNVTINIYTGVSSLLPSNVIGGALPGIRAHQSYSSVVSGLANDATSADDTTAIGSLDRSIFSARFDTTSSSASTTTDNINVTSANAKALSLIGTSSALDGVILFGGLQGSSYTWNYDYARSGAASANSLDFLSTAIHEIGHILGFVSGVDKPGWISQLDFSSPTAMLDYLAVVSDRITYATPLDLFRYSNTASSINDLSYGSNGGRSNKFFSIDKGRTAIASFSTGANKALGGDGYQASHWKDGTPGILDPTLAGGERLSISQTDLRAFDVIGWNLKSATGSLSLNLSALKSQADQALALRLGTTVASLYSNAAMSALNLSSIQSAAVSAMIQDSQIYDWGRKSPTGSSSAPLSQVLDLLQGQTVYGSFDTLDDEVGGSQKSTGGTDFSRLVSSAATLKLSVQQRFAVALPVAGSIQPSKLNVEELTQVIRSITSPIAAEQSWRKIWFTEKQITVESKVAEYDGFNPRSTSRKFSESEALVNTTDLLAL